MEANIDYCRTNDQYGLYKLADKGKLSHLAGVDEEYDVPNEAIEVDAKEKERGVEMIITVFLQ